MARVRVFALGLCIYFCPPLFDRLMAQWFPDEPRHGARVLRRKLWGSLVTVIAVIGGVLVFQHWNIGELELRGDDWLRVFAATVALTAALARGTWSIQSWSGTTVVERVDRTIFVVSQLGAAALLVFVLTL